MAYQWDELERIFNESLSVPIEEKEAFIRKKCAGNPELESALLNMVRQAGAATEYFDNLKSAIASGLKPKQTLSLKEGDIISKYKISTLLDNGGMGEVYLAYRNDGQYEQKVAIKCFSNSELKHLYLQNFRQEQQFLASLNHPNIVHILDAGLTDEGIAFIIMDYVEGLPIDKYLLQNPKSVQEKLFLFLKVCETIQFAHSQMILHLDIKPNNILITGEGNIKLLDFGIAQKVGHHQMIQDQLIATPWYASPEQLQQQNTSVSSDVYQLGILLHVILINKTPFNKSDDFTVERKLDIAKTQINAELVAILNRCLDPKPTARYQSVNQLISEVDNYIKGFPVNEYSNSWLYRTQKYIGRNKIAFGLIILLFLSLLTGVLISYNQTQIAIKQTIAAEQAAEKSAKISEFLISIFESANPELTGSEKISVEEVLTESVNKIQLYPDDLLKADLLLALGTTYSKAGQYEMADTLLSQSIALFENKDSKVDNYFLAYYELSKARMYNSRLEESILTVKQGLEKLPSDKANLLSTAGMLYLQYALAIMEAGDINKADSIFDTSLSIFENSFNPLQLAEAYNVKASILNYKGLPDSSIIHLKKALALLENNASQNQVFYLTITENLASCYRQINELDMALEIRKESIVITEEIFGKDHLEYIKSANGLGLIYRDLDSLDLAYQYLDEAVNLTAELLGEKTLAYVSSAGNLSLVLSKLNQYGEAEELAQKANANALLLAGNQHPFYLWSLGIYADALYKNNKSAEAESNFLKAMKLQKEILGEKHPWYLKSVEGYNSLLKNK